MSPKAETRTRVAYLLANSYELTALRMAEEGDPRRLAEIVSNVGTLRTKEAREFIAARLRGDKRKQGNKRTTAQMAADRDIFLEIYQIQQETDSKEYRARKIYLDRHPEVNEETLKTRMRRFKIETLQDASEANRHRPSCWPHDGFFERGLE